MTSEERQNQLLWYLRTLLTDLDWLYENTGPKFRRVKFREQVQDKLKGMRAQLIARIKDLRDDD